MPDQPAPLALDAVAAPTPARENVAIIQGPPFRALWEELQGWAKSELVPKAYFGKPHDLLLAVRHGGELGLAPVQSIQSIAVINGRATLWGDALLAVVMAAPVYQDHQESFVVSGKPVDTLTAEDLKQDATAAVCTFQRRGKATPATRAFSIADAKRAGLWGKSGTWQAYPQRMLQMRARAFAARDMFPDVLKGIAMAEEWQDVTPSPAAPPPVVRRMSERAPVAPVVVTPAEVLAFTTTPPVRVKGVVATLGGAVVTLSDGREAFAEDPRLVRELGELAGTDHRVVVDIDQSARILSVDVVE